MTEIKEKGLPTRQTKGALGDIYVDTNTGLKYKCTGAFSVTTHVESKKEYEWKPLNPTAKKQQNNVVEKQYETRKENNKVEKVEYKNEKPSNYQTNKKDKHNYTKHFENAKETE